MLPRAGTLQVVHAVAGSSAGSSRGAPPRMMAGKLLRVSHSITDAPSIESFYVSGLGLSSVSSDGSRCVAGKSGLVLELNEVADGGYKPDGGYRGLNLAVPDVAAAVAAAVAAGGTVLRETATVEHGPGPEEPDETENKVVEALVSDPAGYPILIHAAADVSDGDSESESDSEGDAGDLAGPMISGVRCETHDWKASQEWYEENLSWTTLRWQSNVNREASLTVTLGPRGAATPVGPRGAVSETVIQMTYVYGSEPVKAISGSLGAVVLAAGDQDASVWTDPDGYALRLE